MLLLPPKSIFALSKFMKKKRKKNNSRLLSRYSFCPFPQPLTLYGYSRNFYKYNSKSNESFSTLLPPPKNIFTLSRFSKKKKGEKEIIRTSLDSRYLLQVDTSLSKNESSY